MRLLTVFTAAAALLAAPFAIASETAAPAGAAVYFIAPADGAQITWPLTVQFGLKGMGVAPAGSRKPIRDTITC
jgi:hypothetical protein